jgi:hypothetical protein
LNLKGFYCEATIDHCEYVDPGWQRLFSSLASRHFMAQE